MVLVCDVKDRATRLNINEHLAQTLQRGCLLWLPSYPISRLRAKFEQHLTRIILY